ncbi:MAG: glycosyltransferase [Candidatus Methylacidiphilales bacterium]|nr:glycosyltransferase [Candidatus Methylacidiphilales bacterium]
MKILLTADPGIPVPPTGYGGIERIIDALARGLVGRGHAVALVAHPDSTCPGVRLFSWPDLGTTGLTSQMRQAAHLAQSTRRFQPDVVHSFSRLALLLPLMADRQPMVMSYQRHTGGAGVRIAALLGGACLRFSGCSDFICDMGRKAGGDWTTIPNFVETAACTYGPHVPADAPLVFLSRIDRIKGPDLAIAIARKAGRRLILAGNIPSDPGGQAFWQKHIEPELGKNGVEWVGEVDDFRKNELLSSAAALLLPIQWEEPFGIVFAEALACGTPVLTCPRGAAPEIVHPGQNGFLFRTLDGGVEAVERLSLIDRAACRRDAEARFSATSAVERYLDLYQGLLHDC